MQDRMLKTFYTKVVQWKHPETPNLPMSKNKVCNKRTNKTKQKLLKEASTTIEM